MKSKTINFFSFDTAPPAYTSTLDSQEISALLDTKISRNKSGSPLNVLTEYHDKMLDAMKKKIVGKDTKFSFNYPRVNKHWFKAIVHHNFDVTDYKESGARIEFKIK